MSTYRIYKITSAESPSGFVPALDAFCAAWDASLEEIGEPDDEWADETSPGILPASLMPGSVVEVGNLVFQVFSLDATGRVTLDLLEELIEEEDHPLSFH